MKSISIIIPIIVFIISLFIIRAKSNDIILQRVETVNGLYFGFTKNGLYNGLGIHFYKNGDLYVGNWKNGKYDGPGEYHKREKNDEACKKYKCRGYAISLNLWKEGKVIKPFHRYSEGNHTLYGNTFDGFGMYQSDEPVDTIHIGNFNENKLNGFGICNNQENITLGYFNKSELDGEGLSIDFYNQIIVHAIWENSKIKKILYKNKGYPKYFFE